MERTFVRNEVCTQQQRRAARRITHHRALQIDGPTLLKITDARLRQLGLPDRKHREALLAAVAGLRTAGNLPTAKS
jgi:hypothetical protein